MLTAKCGQPVEVVHGAVDRVDDPDDAAGARTVAALLADHPVVGARPEQPLTDQHLAGPVGLGDDVDRAGLGAGDLDAFAAQPDDQVARLASGGQGEVEQRLRGRGRHALNPVTPGRSPRPAARPAAAG